MMKGFLDCFRQRANAPMMRRFAALPSCWAN
jgi:hypothetical protein